MRRTLVATMGVDEGQILPALRLMPYDRLAVVAGRDATRSDGFRKVRAIEPSLRLVLVDPFDLLGCMDAIRRTLREARRDGPVRLSVGGGTKILTSAAILAAFQEGAEAWYCDPDPVRLPVLRGVRLWEALSSEEQALARSIRGPATMERLLRRATDRGISRHLAHRAVLSLAEKGLVDVGVDRGRTLVRATDILAVYRTHLRRAPPKG